MLEHDWNVIWMDWVSFFHLVLNPQDPLRQTITLADVIICEIDITNNHL
jgi:hypothetical protein